MIYISQVHLKNYRRFHDETIPLRPHSVLIGENNAGKTSPVELLDFLLNPTRRGLFIADTNLSHGMDIETTPIEVTLALSPWPGDQFESAERGILDPHVDIYDCGKERVLLKIVHQFDVEQGTIRTAFRFIKADGEDDGGFSLAKRNDIPFFTIAAMRDPSRELGERRGTWARLMSMLEIEQSKQDDVRALGEEIGNKVLETVLGDETFEEAKRVLAGVIGAALWPDGQGGLSFSATPADYRDLLRSLEILVMNPGDTEAMSILSQGDGTQSMAVAALLLSYVVALGYQDPKVAIEEPESHLHPHAVRSFTRYLSSLQHQTIISTHSTFVTDVADPEEITLLKRRGARSIAKTIKPGHLTETEKLQLSRHIHGATSEFFFAKAVVLVEGASEVSTLPIFAKALGIELDRLGISVIPVQGHYNFRPFVRLFQPDALDIKHMIICDNDQAAVAAARLLKELGLYGGATEPSDLETNRESLEELGMYFLPYGNFEDYLLHEGHSTTYVQAIDQLHHAGRFASYVATRVRGDAAYAAKPVEQQISDFIGRVGGKPELAYLVARAIVASAPDGSQIPEYFKRVLGQAASLARAEYELMAADGNAENTSP